MSGPTLPGGPIQFTDQIWQNTSQYDPRVTNLLARANLLPGLTGTRVYSFNRQKAMAEGNKISQGYGDYYNGEGQFVTEPSTGQNAVMIRQKLMNAVNRIHSGYRPTLNDSFGLFVLGHELNHVSTMKPNEPDTKVSDGRADKWSFQNYAKLANMMGITNPRKIRDMLLLARIGDGQSVVLPARLQHRF